MSANPFEELISGVNVAHGCGWTDESKLRIVTDFLNQRRDNEKLYKALRVYLNDRAKREAAVTEEDDFDLPQEPGADYNEHSPWT